MHQTINIYEFREAFTRCGRKDQFSYEALGLLFDYLEEYEEDTGERIELDVIALCCEYAESSIQDLIEQYSIDVDGVDEDELADTVQEYLEENTILVGKTDIGFVYAQF